MFICFEGSSNFFWEVLGLREIFGARKKSPKSLAWACTFCVGLLLSSGASSEAAASVLINGKPLGQIDDIVMETTGSRGVVKESFLKFMKANDGKFRFYPTRGDDKGSPSEKAQVNLGDDGGYTNTGLHPAVGKKRAADGSLVVMYPSSNEKGVTLRFAQVKPDEKGGLSAAKGWSTTIESSGYPYVTDSAAGLFPDGESGSEVFVVAFYTAGGDPSGKKRPGYEQTYTGCWPSSTPWGSACRPGRSGR